MNEAATEYVGKLTRHCLILVEMGWETLPTLKKSRRMTNRPGNYALSLDETMRILEQQQGIQKTTRELIAEMQAYQTGISHIDREPDAYVAPEAARTWYEQQIRRIREQLRDETIEGATA